MVINNVDTESFKSIVIPGKINGYDITMLVDSGSVAKFIDYVFFKEIRTKQNIILFSKTTRT